MTLIATPPEYDTRIEARDLKSSDLQELSLPVVNRADHAESWPMDPPPQITQTADAVIQEAPGSTSSQADLYIDLIAHWASAAMRHAYARPIEQDEWVATVAGLRGALGYGTTETEALNDLRFALADWVHVKLEHGDTDIPILGGINFNPA